MSHANDNDLDNLREYFVDPEFPSEEKDKWFAWSILSAIGNSGAIRISYPAAFVFPALSEFFLKYEIVLLSINSVVLFAASLLAASFHIAYLFLAPNSTKQITSNADFLTFLRANDLLQEGRRHDFDIGRIYRSRIDYSLSSHRKLLSTLILVVFLLMVASVFINVYSVIAVVSR